MCVYKYFKSWDIRELWQHDIWNSNYEGSKKDLPPPPKK